MDLVSILYSIPNLLVVYPLRLLYFQGPTLFGVGGWGGLPVEDICAQFTQVSAELWKAQREHCMALIDRKFKAMVVAFGCGVYFMALYKIMSYLWFRYFVLRPFLVELKSAFPRHIEIEDKKKEV